MSLISGTYFSIQNAPVLVKGLAQILPLTHAVTLTRTLLYRKFENTDFISVAVLVIYFLVLAYFARKVFYKKLIS